MMKKLLFTLISTFSLALTCSAIASTITIKVSNQSAETWTITSVNTSCSPTGFSVSQSYTIPVQGSASFVVTCANYMNPIANVLTLNYSAVIKGITVTPSTQYSLSIKDNSDLHSTFPKYTWTVSALSSGSGTNHFSTPKASTPSTSTFPDMTETTTLFDNHPLITVAFALPSTTAIPLPSTEQLPALSSALYNSLSREALQTLQAANTTTTSSSSVPGGAPFAYSATTDSSHRTTALTFSFYQSY